MITRTQYTKIKKRVNHKRAAKRAAFRAISIVMVLCMMIAVAGASAFAEDMPQPASEAEADAQIVDATENVTVTVTEPAPSDETPAAEGPAEEEAAIVDTEDAAEAEEPAEPVKGPEETVLSENDSEEAPAEEAEETLEQPEEAEEPTVEAPVEEEVEVAEEVQAALMTEKAVDGEEPDTDEPAETQETSGDNAGNDWSAWLTGNYENIEVDTETINPDTKENTDLFDVKPTQWITITGGAFLWTDKTNAQLSEDQMNKAYDAAKEAAAKEAYEYLKVNSKPIVDPDTDEEVSLDNISFEKYINEYWGNSDYYYAWQSYYNNVELGRFYVPIYDNVTMPIYGREGNLVNLSPDENNPIWIKLEDHVTKPVEIVEKTPEELSNLADNQLWFNGIIGDKSDISAITKVTDTYETYGELNYQLYELTDKDGNNYYVYCADANVPTDFDKTYTKTDIAVLEPDYNAEKDSNPVLTNIHEAAGKLAAIVLNGYNNGGDVRAIQNAIIAALSKDQSDEKTKEITDIVSNLTPGLALTATQTAIWYYTNPGLFQNAVDNELNPVEPPVDENGDGETGDGETGDGETGDSTDDKKPDVKVVWKKFTNNTQLGGAYDESLTNEERAALFAAIQYFLDLAPVELDEIKAEAPSTETLEVKVTNIKPASNASSGEVKADASKTSQAKDVLFTIAELNESKWNKDEITVVAYVNGQPVKTIKLSDAEITEDGTYIITGIELADGQTVNVEIKSERTSTSVYVFTADCGINDSQTLIGAQDTKHELTGSGDMLYSVTTKPTPSTSTDPEPTPSESTEPSPTPTPSSSTTPKPTPTPTGTPAPTPTPSVAPTPTPVPTPNVVTATDPEVPVTRVYTPDEPQEYTPPRTTVTLAEEPRTRATVRRTPLRMLRQWDDHLIDIMDLDVPLAAVPKTGDDSQVWRIMAFISGAAFIAFMISEQRREKKAALAEKN